MMAVCGSSPQWGRFLWEKAFWYDPPHSELTHTQHRQWTSAPGLIPQPPSAVWRKSFCPFSFIFGRTSLGAQRAKKTQAHFFCLMAKVSSYHRHVGLHISRVPLLTFNTIGHFNGKGQSSHPPEVFQMMSGQVGDSDGVRSCLWVLAVLRCRHRPGCRAPSAPGGFSS